MAISLETVRQTATSALHQYPWVQELASLLPLSALIEFLDIPRVLHSYQLSGLVPWWCWPITPSGSRVILAQCNVQGPCCLDEHGSSPSMTCLDGRYGDSYVMASPETVRLCLQSATTVEIPNNHPNMQAAPPRVQKLGVIKVTRSTHEKHGSNIMYRASSISGWVLLVAVLIFACLMQFWLLVSFLLVVCTTGFLISVTFGSRLRQVNVPYSTNQNRLVVAARHMNETEWQAFYGESRVVNSLLNWPLLVQGQPRSQHMNVVLYWCLRILILSQWMLAIGAAASKGWEAFGIIGWIVLCLFCHNFIFTPSRCAGWWLRHTSGVQVERYNLSLSSRRALLNTLMALNPDTLSKSSISVTGLAELHHEALLWIDPILKKCQSRTEWEETSKKALFRTAHEDARTLADPSKNSTAEGEKKADEMAWEQRQPWYPFIAEGIEMAARVKVHARLDQIFAEAANAG